MCGESTRPGEAVPGWDVSAVGRKTTWPRGMTAVLLWTLYSMNSTCGDVHGEGETEKLGTLVAKCAGGACGMEMLCRQTKALR